MQLDPAEMRQHYDMGDLDEADLAQDPFDQFGKWFEDARKADLMEPNAMALATANRDGVPSNRMVLMKGFDQRGFTFFSNYESRKGAELAENSMASLLFWWDRLHRQVRIEGQVARVDGQESDEYYRSRPKGSRIGAAASPQSRTIVDREWLANRFAELEREYPDAIPRPAHWGGFRLQPNRFEFWQGRPSRLHDRLNYTLDGEAWQVHRLAP